MKTMLMTLALLPVLAAGAAAQDLRWSDLAPGDRVEVTFRNGGTIGGAVVSPHPKEPFDAARESSLLLDMSLQYPGQEGTLTVAKQDVRSIRRLHIVAVPSAGKAPEVKPAPSAPAPAPAAAPAPAPPAEPAAPEKSAKDAEDLKKAAEFYAKYPPPFWGPERHTLNLQKRARGQAWSPAEREFEEGYPGLWEKGRAASAPKPN